jgi:hypothetical protein
MRRAAAVLRDIPGGKVAPVTGEVTRVDRNGVLIGATQLLAADPALCDLLDELQPGMKVQAYALAPSQILVSAELLRG